jgi:hypothetical protein
VVKGELWTMALHQPVDTRKLDSYAREVLREGRRWLALKQSSMSHASAEKDLELALGKWEDEVMRQVLAEPEVEG